MSGHITAKLDEDGLVEIGDDWTENPDLHSQKFCPQCGTQVVVQSFEVPCCGGGFPCTDSNTEYLCTTCKLYASDW